MVRLLIVGKEMHTMIANAGFFSYLYFHAFYNNWLVAEDNFAAKIEGLRQHSATQELFLREKSHFFILFVVQIISYYLHTYGMARWPFSLPTNDSKAPEETQGDAKDDKNTKKDEKSKSAKDAKTKKR